MRGSVSLVAYVVCKCKPVGTHFPAVGQFSGNVGEFVREVQELCIFVGSL